MRAAIMQPYYFPYLGYFSLIKNADRFVVFDTPQYIRHGWVDRNRVLKQNGGWQYLKVPVVKPTQNTPINKVEISEKEDWKNKTLAQLTHYKKKSRRYHEVVALVDRCLAIKTNNLAEQLTHSLKETCSYIGLAKKIEVFSQMNLTIGDVSAPDEWGLEICKSMGAGSYVNAIGGKEFFDTDKYAAANIPIQFLDFQIAEYKQKGDPFEPGLSIIDVLMFNSPERVLEMLDDFVLV